jgi:hypothetical protein
MTTWALGTATAMAVAWFAVSSVVAGVTASGSGPSLVGSAAIASEPANDGAAPRRGTLARTVGSVDPQGPATPTSSLQSPTASSATSSSTVLSPRPGEQAVGPMPSRSVTTTTLNGALPNGTAAVASSPPTTENPSPHPATTTTTSPTSQTFASRGGVTTVACSNQGAQLLSVSPNNGYQMRIDDQGPPEVRVEFIGPTAQTEISVTCVSGKASAVYDE